MVIFISFEKYQTLGYWTNVLRNDFIDVDTLIVKLQNDNSSLKFQKLLDTRFSFNCSSGNVTYYGKRFDKKWNYYLHNLNLLDVQTDDDEKVFNSSPVIVTAISSNHFRESFNLLKSISNVYQNKKMVYVYDLGLR